MPNVHRQCWCVLESSTGQRRHPWLMLTDTAMGIVYIYNTAQPEFTHDHSTSTVHRALSYYIISLSLDVLLTLMIAIRLVLCSRNIRKATGASVGASGVYKTIVTTLVESSALLAVAFLLYIGTWAAGTYVMFAFVPILSWVQVRAVFVYLNHGALFSNRGDAQVIAPFLITLRVANRKALTSEMVSSGNLGSIHFRSQGRSKDDIGTLPDGNPADSMETNGEAPCGLGFGTETTIEEVP